MTPHTPAPTEMSMKYKYGKQRTRIGSYKEASEKWAAFRNSTGLGASELGQAVILDETGKVAAYISYNGKVWAGAPKDWQSGMTPLFNPFAA